MIPNDMLMKSRAVQSSTTANDSGREIVKQGEKLRC